MHFKVTFQWLVHVELQFIRVATNGMAEDKVAYRVIKHLKINSKAQNEWIKWKRGEKGEKSSEH